MAVGVWGMSVSLCVPGRRRKREGAFQNAATQRKGRYKTALCHVNIRVWPASLVMIPGSFSRVNNPTIFTQKHFSFIHCAPCRDMPGAPRPVAGAIKWTRQHAKHRHAGECATQQACTKVPTSAYGSWAQALILNRLKDV